MVRGTSKQPPEHLTRNAAPLSITMIGPIPLTRQAKRNWLQINTISLYEINKAVMGQLGIGAGSRELVTGQETTQEQGLGVWSVGQGWAGPESGEVR
jgi:hypothetical protein